jgi:hypothetical protein
MHKPLLVATMLLAGLISVGFTPDTASYNSSNGERTMRTVSPSQTEQSGSANESVIEATSYSASFSSSALSPATDTDLLGTDSCRPVPVEVKPCQ